MTLINTFKRVQAASRGLALLSEATMNQVLRDLADAAEAKFTALVVENRS
jgi:hypothetical protein